MPYVVDEVEDVQLPIERLFGAQRKQVLYNGLRYPRQLRRLALRDPPEAAA